MTVKVKRIDTGEGYRCEEHYDERRPAVVIIGRGNLPGILMCEECALDLARRIVDTFTETETEG